MIWNFLKNLWKFMEICGNLWKFKMEISTDFRKLPEILTGLRISRNFHRFPFPEIWECSHSPSLLRLKIAKIFGKILKILRKIWNFWLNFEIFVKNLNFLTKIWIFCKNFQIFNRTDRRTHAQTTRLITRGGDFQSPP